MRRGRVHITGGSGTGTTTLALALADQWAVPHADADDYFWVPTVSPYVVKRPEPERVPLMEALFVPRDAWVLSGSLMGWGDALVDRFDLVVFLVLDPTERLARLEARERLRHGPAVGPGGVGEAQHQSFMAWARGYDDDDFEGRSRARHERWLSTVPCPVLRLDSAMPVADLVAAVTPSIQPADRHRREFGS
jgi:adenylate kinase family enzyme